MSTSKHLSKSLCNFILKTDFVLAIYPPIIYLGKAVDEQLKDPFQFDRFATENLLKAFEEWDSPSIVIRKETGADG